MLSNREVINYLDSNIETLKSHFNRSKSSSAKEQIREKWIFTELKKIAIESNNKDLKKAYDILKSEDLVKANDALNYINSINFTLSKKEELKVVQFKALLNELLIKYEDASKEYKMALKDKFDTDTLKLYKEFLERNKNSSLDMIDNAVDSLISYVVDYKDNTQDLLKSAKSLESLAKYYSRSDISIDTARAYYKQALEIYKQAMSVDSKESKNYILALIKAVETYKMDVELLDEAQKLIFHSNEFKDTQMYLLNKINILKNRV